MLKHPVPLPHLSIPGALTLARELLAAAEPIEKRPAFLAAALMRLDDAVRELRGAMQYKSQLVQSRPSRQQRARAEVESQFALDAVKGAIRSYALRVSVIVDESLPETVDLARHLIAPLVEWERRDARVFRLPLPEPGEGAEAPAAMDHGHTGGGSRGRRRVAAAA